MKIVGGAGRRHTGNTLYESRELHTYWLLVVLIFNFTGKRIIDGMGSVIDI